MADKGQTPRDMQPRKWVPPTREAAPTAPAAPCYPSFSDPAGASRLRLDAAVRRDPEGAAAQLAAALQADAEEQLIHFLGALRQRLEADDASAPKPDPLQDRLQALESTVAALAEKLERAQTQTQAEAEAYEPATAHDAILWRVRNKVRQRSVDGAMLVRTMLMDMEGEEVEDEAAESSGVAPLQKVAILAVGLGDEIFGDVIKHLADHEIERITQAIAALKSTPAEVVDRILEEFEQRLLSGEWLSQGGVDFARAALERAVGPQKAQEMLARVTTRVSSGFYMLKNVAPDQIAPFISHEHPQTVALILSQLDPAQASGILTQLPERMQADVAYRIATMENITPNVIKQVEEGLDSSLRDLLGGNQDVGGPKVVADILNLTGSSVEKNVLEQMDGQAPDVSEAVRNLMFLFEDIAKLTDRELQTLLRDVDHKDLVVALKAASADLRAKVLGNVSNKARTFITDEMELLGPMRLSEVEEVQLRIVQQVRELHEQGQITIVRGDSPDQFV